ncbi:hypothetical protein FOL46_000273 [Perkinsus olseni]|uniref:Glycosyltransferase 2-like domain-containing protein n=2 Tax=Perkinsus olseni TaxID=32597 RepID=A0A7J6KYM6_PEROL|nr:hypothetical protein FOL46_000273 [Perkinsus olseni]
MSIKYDFLLADRMKREGITVPYGTPPEEALERCILPHDDEGFITCFSVNSCDYMCREADTNGRCPAGKVLEKDKTDMDNNVQCNIWLAGQSFTEQLACYKLEVAAYCGRKFEVTPSNILAIRGLIVATVVMILFWIVAEFALRSVDRGLRQEQAEGMARMGVELPAKRRFLRQQILERWAAEARFNYAHASQAGSVWGNGTTPGGNESMVSPSVAAQSPYGVAGAGEYMSDVPGVKSQLQSRNPKKRFESNAWRRRLDQYRNLNQDKKKAFVNKEKLRTGLLNIFFILLVIFTEWFIMRFSPQHMNPDDSLYDAFVGVVSIWDATSVLDWLIFLDVLLDIFLFGCAMFVVKWPKKPVFAEHMQEELKASIPKAIEEEEDDDDDDEKRPLAQLQQQQQQEEEEDDDDMTPRSMMTAPSDESETVDFVLSQGMTRDVCLLIACHQSTMTEERYETFTATLRAALMVFPPSHIFVCDNGVSPVPVDDNQWATQQVHPDINYLYVPEGNKTFAFYWCNKYWIPYLVQNGRVTDFKYAVIIDDDVPLPPDLHIPHQLLDQNPNIKAVHFPITAATPDGKPNLLVQCQDIEYKIAGLHKLFQATLARSLSCHGAVALWDRETLDEIFYEHDTVFNGEDMYMGLSLLRKRDDSKIISSAQAIVPTYAPDNWGMLFRQRVKSWDVTSHKKTFTYIWEIINPRSWCHLASWVLKPYFLQELLTIVLDWLRTFLLCGLIIRDWVSFLFMFVIFTGLIYVMVVLFEIVVLRDRHDLRSSFCACLTFPWYRLSSLVFRVGALLQNLLVYSHVRKGIKIRVREDEIRDIPPCPPSPDVDWFTVWTGDIPEDEKQQAESTIPEENDGRVHDGAGQDDQGSSSAAADADAASSNPPQVIPPPPGQQRRSSNNHH